MRLSSFARFDGWLKVWAIALIHFVHQVAHGAGVTVITHGSSGLNRDYPSWVNDMGAAIAVRAGSAAVYNVDVGILPNQSFGAYFNYESGTPPSANSSNSEVVIKVFWYKVAGLADTITATDVANVVTPFFEQFNLAPNNGGPVIARPLAELPIHLIGHSRGGSVVSEISRLLATHGAWVEQVTTLDPHSQTPDDCVLLLFCPGAYDSPVNIYDNVLFADNYYQIDNTGLFPISGRHIDGTTEEQLTQQFDLDGINDSGNFSDHMEVHEWYYGTINLAATTASGFPLPRSVWYPVPFPFTYARGFALSRITGGQWLREHPEFQLGFTNVGWKFDINALRNPNYSHSGAQWPNVFLDNTNGIWTAQAGQTINFQVRYRDAFSSGHVTIDFGVDDDQNPYNNPSANIFLTSTNSATANSNWVGSRAWTPTMQDDGKFIYAKITDLNGLVRYYYLPSSFHVTAPPPPTISIPTLSPSGIQFFLSSVVGQHYTVQSSMNLVAWSDLMAFTSTNTSVVVVDSGASGFNRRFYRATSP